MGTQQSSRVKGSKLQQSPSSSTLRNLRFEEPATPFASPPKTSEKSSPQRGKSLWRRGSGETSSQSTARPPSPDIEAQNARPPSPDLKVDSSDIDQVVDDDQRAMAFFGGDARHQDKVPARKPSKASLRSFDSSMGNLAPPRSFDSPCGNAAPSAERHRRSQARGTSQARPRWSRPQAATDSSVVQGRTSSSSDSVIINADQFAAFHPQYLGSEFQLDERDPSIIQAEMLAKASQQKSDDLDFKGMKALAYEPPPTPSTIMSESGMNCTQSSMSSTSGWNSRPTTSCSNTSSISRMSMSEEILGVGNGGIDPRDCSRESRMRAHGAHMPDGETLHSLTSFKSAWGAEVVDIAEAP